MPIAFICVVATTAACALFAGTSSREASAGTTAGQIDIELAFDTTLSMRPTIEQAKRDGASIVARVREAFPETQFAVVSFRDYGNTSGDYQVLQPMTGDVGAVATAFSKLRTAGNSSASNSYAEEYNLLFQRSYTDAAVNWRPQSRKVVVVVGDAQPHGAGASGIPGCTDKSTDYYGLNTADVLAGMRAAQRTLVMIRNVSAETTASLECYEAIADRAYVGGAARNGGDTNLPASILALIQDAVVPVTLRPDVGLALPGGSAGYTATISNPNSFALTLRSVDVTLPAEFRYRAGSSTGPMSVAAGAPTQVTWNVGRVLDRSEKVSLHFRAVAPKRRGRYGTRTTAQLQLPAGNVITSTDYANLRVATRLRGLVVSARGERQLQRSGTATLRGAARITFGRKARKLGAGKLRPSRLVVASGPGRSVSLRVRSYRIVSFGSPTVVKLRLSVERVRGGAACSAGARGSATIVDDQRFNAAQRRQDAVVLSFGAGCRFASGRWVNTGAGRAAVTSSAR